MRHLPECSVCLVHFTVSGDQPEAAGLDSTLVPLLLCQLGAASIHTGLREEVDDTGRVESAGSRSLGVNELLVGVGWGRVQDRQGFQERHAAKTFPRSGEAGVGSRAFKYGGNPVERV